MAWKGTEVDGLLTTFIVEKDKTSCACTDGKTYPLLDQACGYEKAPEVKPTNTNTVSAPHKTRIPEQTCKLKCGPLVN